jgi:hypothetical protein
MKRIKQIDLYGQLVIISGFVVATLLWENASFIIGYFVVGLWQVISMLMHYLKGWNMRRGGKRYIYLYISAFTILLLAGAFILPRYLFIIFYIMLFAAPFMAIYYTIICYMEVANAERRPSEVII